MPLPLGNWYSAMATFSTNVSSKIRSRNLICSPEDAADAAQDSVGELVEGRDGADGGHHLHDFNVADKEVA